MFAQRATELAPHGLLSLLLPSSLSDLDGYRAARRAVLRTHSLHDPIAYKKREVGDYVLRNEVPEPTWYT